MYRENSSRVKHKSPKFREIRDEESDWTDRFEVLKRKRNRKARRRESIREKW